MQGLAAKINPCPKIPVKGNNLLDVPTIVDADHILVMARPYLLGSALTPFEVEFGTLKTDSENRKVFTKFLNQEVLLTSQELTNWGTNDETCFQAIAAKLGTSCVSFEGFDAKQ